MNLQINNFYIEVRSKANLFELRQESDYIFAEYEYRISSRIFWDFIRFMGSISAALERF